MKLLNCHIENFGKLTNFDIEFNGDLNTICYENGWGKSTLTTFIRVMFYGFEGERKRTAGNERVDYRPWQGGVYGGKIEFEVNDKKYCITRIFGKKEKEDVFELRDLDTQLESDDFSSEIGKELFGINSEAFMRTVFIGQSDCVTSVNGDINAKMGNLTEDAEDINNYDYAIQLIKDYLNKNSPKTSRGTIHKLKDDMAHLDAEIRKEVAINEAILELQEKMEEQKEKLECLKTEQEEIKNRQKISSEYKEMLSKKERYEEIQARYDEASRKWHEMKELFPVVAPIKEELEKIMLLSSEMNEGKGLLMSYQLEDEEERKLVQYEAKYKENIPSEPDFTDFKVKYAKLQNERIEWKASILTEEEKENLERYQNKFGSNVALTQKIATYQNLWTDRMLKSDTLTMRKEELKRLKDLEEQGIQKKEDAKSSKLNMIGILLLIVGLAVAIKMLVPGILIAVVGIVCFIIGNNKKKSNSLDQEAERKSKILQLKNEISKDEEFISQTDSEISKYLSKFGMAFEISQIPSHLQELMRESMRYEDLHKKEEKAKTNDYEASSAALEQELHEFFNPYHIVCNESEFLEAISELEREVADYKYLKKKRNSYKDAKERYEEKKCIIESFIKEIGDEPEEAMQEQLLKIQDRFNRYHQAEEAFLAEKNLKLEFEEKNDVSQFNKDMYKDVGDLIELNAEYEEKNNQIDQVLRTMKDYEDKFDERAAENNEVAIAKERLEILKAEIEESTKKYQLIEKTQKLLTKAKEALTARYIKPLKDSYSKYYEVIAGEVAEAYHLDANANLTVDQVGMQREVTTLSAGYKDLVGLCLRLAFVEAMYEEEKPMIILDDPFVNLDQQKLQGGKALLEVLVKEYQVIYLTCHESRK